MAANNFDRCLAALLLYEGGNSDDKRDPGGRTSRGITQRVYDAFRRANGLPTRDVFVATDDEVKQEYKLQYWNAIQGDALPSGVDECVFDEAANSGPVRAIKDLQTVLGVASDGHLGIVTLGALNSVNDRASLINRYCDNRLSWLHRLRTWNFFGKGWSNRIAAVRKLSLGLATN